MTPEQLASIHERADRARSIAHGPNALHRALASADDVPDLLAEVERLTAERDRYREHSITLNTVAFAIADAVGDVPPGADSVEGNPIEQAEKLIRQRDSLGRRCSARFAEREEARAEAQQARDERDRALKVIRQAYEAGDDAWRICANALHPTDPTKLAEAEPPTGWRDETTGLISGGLITD